MHNILKSFALIVLSIALGLQPLRGQNKVVTETRPAGTFTRIVNTCSANIELSQGDKNEIQVEADESIIGDLKTTINGNTLTIEMGNARPFRTVRKLKVRITASDLQEIVLNGLGDLITLNPLHSPDLKLKINGSEDARIIMKGGNFEASINGSGDVSVKDVRGSLSLDIHGSGDFTGQNLQLDNAVIACHGSGNTKLEGKAATLKINSFASGDVNTMEMPAEKALLEVRGSGDVKIRALQSVKANVYGSSDIIVEGNPKDRQLSRHGSGSIRFL